jgi:hypothetical protein
VDHSIRRAARGRGYDVMFGSDSRDADHAGHDRSWPTVVADTSLPKARRRTIEAIRDRLSRLLASDEPMLDFTEAIGDAPLLARAVLGAAWAPSHRVALVFTPRRLVEIGLSATGRRALGRVRSFPWDRIAGFTIHDEWLEIRGWDEKLHRWRLRDLPDAASQERVHRQADLAVSAYGPTSARPDPVLHCSRCGARRHDDGSECSRCGAAARIPGRAARLAVAVPGGGHLYAERRPAAALRFVAEIVVFAAVAYRMLGTTDLWRVLGLIGVGTFALGLMKCHALMSARRLAERAGTVSRTGDRLWRLAQPAGLLVSLAALVAPLTMIGAMDDDLSWDLVPATATGDWTGSAVTTAEVSTPLVLRSRWTHRDGQVVTMRAWPFEPFESAAATRSRVVSEYGASDEPFRIGSHLALRAVEPLTRGSGASINRITLFVIDPLGRDVHAVSTDSDEPDRAEERLRDLLERSYWVRPRARLSPDSGPPVLESGR